MRLASLAVAACALVACVHTAPQTAADEGAEPLHVVLLTEPPGAHIVPVLSFVLNRPAYVAAFEVVPGRGVRLLYPADSAQQPSNEGLNLVSETPSYYEDYLLPRWMPQAYGQPHFTYIVASDTPIELGALSEPNGLRQYFGIERFASFTPSRFMDEIAAATIASGLSDASWTTDVAWHWPNALAVVGRTLAIATFGCLDGSEMTVPATYGARHCPGDPLRTQMVWVDGRVEGRTIPVTMYARKNGLASTRTPPTGVSREPGRAPVTGTHGRSEPSARSHIGTSAPTSVRSEPRGGASAPVSMPAPVTRSAPSAPSAPSSSSGSSRSVKPR
ncbi:MAG TPA: hypothetical protein VIC55_05490 [Gemmatimonadaceae bacterium]|jgi:hypothetical protein